MIYKIIILLLVVVNLGCSSSKSKPSWESFKKSNPHLYLENKPVLKGSLDQRFVELSKKDIEKVKSNFSTVEDLKIEPKPVKKIT